MAEGLDRFRQFLCQLTKLCDAGAEEHDIIEHGGASLRGLVAEDDWLPPEFAEPDAKHYRQYLLYCDPLERFSVVSFVWGPGQRTPVHDHTVWGLIGMLRGSEIARNYGPDADSRLAPDGEDRLTPGMVAAVSPRIGDIHSVENALADRPSISIHAYGANIGGWRGMSLSPRPARPSPSSPDMPTGCSPTCGTARRRCAPASGPRRPRLRQY
jgi:predicted metal-dependent enzyme (double-stranded beta helix superfamily)